VDGVTFTRSSNTFTDVITGANISLHSTTTGSAAVSLNNDYTVAKTAIEAFVEQANNSMSSFKSMLDSSTGGALSSNSVFKQIYRDLLGVITNESTTPGSTITRLSDIGVSINRQGTLDIDETTLDSVLSSNFSEVRKIFSADTDNQSSIGEEDRGIAGDLSMMISDLSSSSGYFSIRTTTIEGRSSEYATDLEELEERLARIEERYTKQFSAMQRVVNEMNTLRESLTSTFENLPYSNKD
jgi:flagellar hook-associated protein 2